MTANRNSTFLSQVSLGLSGVSATTTTLVTLSCCFPFSLFFPFFGEIFLPLASGSLVGDFAVLLFFWSVVFSVAAMAVGLAVQGMDYVVFILQIELCLSTIGCNLKEGTHFSNTQATDLSLL